MDLGRSWLKRKVLRFLGLRASRALPSGPRLSTCAFATMVCADTVEFEGWNTVDWNANLTGKIRVGAYSTIGMDCILFGGKSEGVVTLGRYTQLGPRVSIWAVNHATNHLTTYNPTMLFEGRMKEFATEAPVTIGNDVWIGANSILLSGVSIGNCTIVGAGSVVTRPLPPFSVAVGNPARVVRERFTPELRAAISEWQWWRLSAEELAQHEKIFAVDCDVEPELCCHLIRNIICAQTGERAT